MDKEHSLLLILKWGGELTMMGKDQAEELGRAFRYCKLSQLSNYIEAGFC